MNPSRSINRIIGLIAGAATIAIVGLVTFVHERSEKAALGASVPTSTPIADMQTPPPASLPEQASYKDGTYTATGSYMSPGGQDQVTVTLTLANSIITSVSVTASGDRTSQHYQSKFLSGYKQYVVGMNISSVNLTHVSGSSLTPIGFDNALSQIKSQAQA
jgi:uncharacterized protein with FMN-binding domain